MTFKMYSSRIRTIRQDDKDFRMQDGILTSPRAGFEISVNCPSDYKSMLSYCIDMGYIKPVAYMKDSELMWDTLQQ